MIIHRHRNTSVNQSVRAHTHKDRCVLIYTNVDVFLLYVYTIKEKKRYKDGRTDLNE